MSDGGLFESVARERLSNQAPLAARLRPRTLDEVVGQTHLLGPTGPLASSVSRDRLVSLLFWGPAGTGKTTLARLVAAATSTTFTALSATSAGVKDAREAIEAARRLLGEQGQRTVLFVDEVHRFSTVPAGRAASGGRGRRRDLRRGDDGEPVLRGQRAAAQPHHDVPAATRSTRTRFGSSSHEVRSPRTSRSPTRRPRCSSRARTATRGAPRDPRGRGRPGARSDVAGDVAVEVDDVVRARDGRILHQGRDEHYDQVSALIKSVRGSDPDAALYWLARMLEAGESPRFVARRLVILASEDVGMADPCALVVATAAASALELVGLPEAQLALAQATVHLALAPKSNRVTTALGAAQRDVREGPRTDVPVAPARCELRRRRGARARRRVRLPARRSPRLGRPAVPPRRARRAPLLVRVDARRGAGARRMATRREERVTGALSTHPVLDRKSLPVGSTDGFQRGAPLVHALLRGARAHLGAVGEPDPARPEHPVHDRRDGPVQAVLPRRGAAAARPDDDDPEVLPRRTTSRTSGSPHGTAPSSRCSATSASATTSRKARSGTPGTSSPRSTASTATGSG